VTPRLEAEDAEEINLDLESPPLSFSGEASVIGLQSSPLDDVVDVDLKMLLVEIHSIRELLSIEPESKWAQFTLARLARRAKWHRASTEPLLKALQVNDALRAQYYLDLESRWCVEDVIEAAGPCTTLSLTSLRLASLPPPNQLSTILLGLSKLDLSNNGLTGTDAFMAPAFPLLEELRLDHNRIGAIATGSLSSLPNLKSLSIKSNALTAYVELVACTGLLELSLDGNPCCEEDGFNERLAAMLKHN